MRYVPPIPGSARLGTAAITMGAAVARRAHLRVAARSRQRLGAAAPSVCDPACSLDAVTVFTGRGFTGQRWEMRGSSASATSDGASRREGLWLRGSLYVPDGFVVHLAEDANWFQRDRRHQQTIHGPWAGDTPSWPVVIIAVQDARSAAEKDRAVQVDALTREATLSEAERMAAESLRRELETTTRELAAARQLQVQREDERSAIIEAQTREAAEQAAQAAAEQAAAKARGEYQGQLLAQQQFLEQQRAMQQQRAGGGGSKRTLIIAAVAGGALLLALALRGRKSRGGRVSYQSVKR